MSVQESRETGNGKWEMGDGKWGTGDGGTHCAMVPIGARPCFIARYTCRAVEVRAEPLRGVA